MLKKQQIILVIYLLSGYITYGQTIPLEYIQLIEKARLFARSEDYKKAAYTYAEAFRVTGSSPTFEDRANAACYWSLSNYPDSAITQLFVLADSTNFTYYDIQSLLTDTDLDPIKKDSRMDGMKTKLFLKAYKNYMTTQKEAGVNASFLKQENLPFAIALGNRIDSAILKLNEPAYSLLSKKDYGEAFKLFMLNINEFGRHRILYRNIVDYYLAVGDTPRAFINFARSEEMKYEDLDSLAKSNLDIDSAIKKDYNIFSKVIGSKIVAPVFLMSNFSTAQLRKEVSKQEVDTALNTKVINPAHPVKHPIVGYDESHGNAFAVTGKMKKFGELLKNDGYDVIVDTGRFTATQLRKYNILITAGAFKNWLTDPLPQAYTASEIEAVRNWVIEGGSLLLMTDHPPFDVSVSAMVSGLGATSGIGIVMDPANTYKIHGKEDARPGWIIFSKENKGLSNHPILMGRDKTERIIRVMSQGGSSVSGPRGSTNILSFAKSAENQMHRTFIGPSKLQAAQMVAYNLGKGKVVITADGTMFTGQIAKLQNGNTFGLGISRSDFDNKQLALNVMHWLSGAIK